ncbi:MAG: prepilin-type N-terminal cleavage/methylation domain-containing protein [Candidatus Omnitrophica bacterium]|nr:prepilin-type N-terminal cleavage/methylation domain-containing protein [Candidatus Omnitrophota bacterium]
MKKGFTLLEVMVSITVFSLVFLASGQIFSSIQASWQKQKNTADLLHESRWAMEKMSNELFRAQAASIATAMAGARLRFRIDPDADGVAPFREIEYIRQATVLNRRFRDLPGGWVNPYQELANDLAANPVFSWDGTMVTITMTVNKGAFNYTLITKVRPRN